MKFFSSIAIVIVLAGTALAQSSGAAAAPPILPKEFGGWQLLGRVDTSSAAAVADPVNPQVLKEYGFTDFASAVYKRDDGRKLTIRAARFGDASGAYGAFTFYVQPPMLPEKIGDQGASLNNRVLFYRGGVLVDALFQSLTAMSAAELRELAQALPLPQGGAGNLPTLANYLPQPSRQKNSVHYVLGPVALQKVNSPLTPGLVDFGAANEAVMATYDSSGGDATLLLINYPTPQIAAEHLRRIDAARQPNNQQTGATTVLDVGPIFDKRTGPIVAVAAGPLSQSEARSLLASVNYDADVTWNENTYQSKKDNIGNLVWNALLLCGILMAFALVFGVAFRVDAGTGQVWLAGEVLGAPG